MTCAPALLKFLGIRLSAALTESKLHAEQRLFQAILLQALEDGVSTSGFKKETYHKDEANRWFLEDSEDFKKVCWSADMDPEFVRGEYIRLCKQGKIRFSNIQLSWIRYRNLYKSYRMAANKEERRTIKKLILEENKKREIN